MQYFRRFARNRLLVEHGLFRIPAALNANHAENLVTDLKGGGLRATLSTTPETSRPSV
jgi:hypothetical protein